MWVFHVFGDRLCFSPADGGERLLSFFVVHTKLRGFVRSIIPAVLVYPLPAASILHAFDAGCLLNRINYN
jgi:hypothetical protein